MSIIVLSVFISLKLISYSNLILYPKKPNGSNIPSHWNVSAANPKDYGLEYETVSIITVDGINLSGWFIPGKNKKAIILVHGFEANKIKMLRYCPFLNETGFNILLFDLRYFGESQGKYCSLGYYEKKDIQAAVKFIKDRGIRDVGILAESMGAAATVLVLKDEGAVKCAVLDSPFSDLRELLLYRGKEDKNLNHWIVKLIEFIVERRLDYSMKWVSPGNEISKINTPVFVICGQKDQEVPFEQGEELYDKANNPKFIWRVDCGHTESFNIYAQEYKNKVSRFFNKYLIP